MRNFKRPNVNKKAIIRLALLVALSVILAVVYKLFIDTRFGYIVFWCYAAAVTALSFGYVIYNRGMSRKNVTRDMLPDEWSEEQKSEFVEDGKRRLEKSKWMLMFIFAFVVSFAVDILELFVFPFFEGLFL